MQNKIINGICLFLWLTSILFAQQTHSPSSMALGDGSSLNQGLVAYYPFNGSQFYGNANDESGNGHNGAFSYSVGWVTDRFGNTLSAVSFDGINGMVEVPHSDIFNYYKDTLSLSVWFNIREYVQWGGLICKASKDNISNYCISTLSNKKLEININHYCLCSEAIQTTMTFPQNEWHHLVVIFTPSQVKLYVDGKFNNQMTLTNLPMINTAPLYFGVDTDGQLEYFNGSLDDIRIYKRVLSDSEILELYNETPEFTEQNTISLPPLCAGSSPLGDYDNDDYLDLLFTSKIYRNNGNNTFTEQTSILLPGAFESGSTIWGDFNNDGYLDILWIEKTEARDPASKIFYNNGDNTFSEKTIFPIGGMWAAAAWGDYDNDGYLDVIITGKTPSYTDATKIYHNNNDNTFTERISLIGTRGTLVAWGDYDNDGFLDFLLGGITTVPGSSLSRVYHNNGDNSFTEQTIKINGVGIWGDYDNDGYLDIMTTIYSHGLIDYIIYCNNGDNSFTERIIFTQHYWGGFRAFGDYDNDGDLDILLTGYDENEHSVLRVFRNNGDNSFTKAINFSNYFSFNMVWWADYDNDGDLDVLVTTFAPNKTIIFRNNIKNKNKTPSKPTHLKTSIIGSDVTFIWNKSTDAETPQNGLTYNLVMGTKPGSVDILSPMSDITTGKRRIVSMGNAGSCNFKIIKGLPEGKYYWSVQAIDNNFAGSEFAEEQVFEVTSSCPSGMISYWKLDEISGNTFKDEIGINDAAAVVSPHPTSGQVNGAQKFNGRNTRINVPANPSIDFGKSSPFSVEFWYKSPVIPSDYTAAVGRYISNTGARWSVGIDVDGTARFYIISGTGASVHGTVVTDGKWHHIAAAKGSNGMKIYVDGKLIEGRVRSFGADFSSPTIPLNIGYYMRDPSNILSGSLDEIAIYSKELTTDEIQQHYNNGLQHLGYCGQSASSKQIAIEGINSDNSTIPTEYLLEQNYPNPFNPSTTIKYSVPDISQVTIKVFDILGTEVETLVNEQKSAGAYEANFNAKHLSSGVYFYRIQAGSFLETKKMILMK